MKIRIIKHHAYYGVGIHNLPEERGNYLIKMGVAEEVTALIPTIENKIFSPEIEIKKRGPKPKNKL